MHISHAHQPASIPERKEFKAQQEAASVTPAPLWMLKTHLVAHRGLHNVNLPENSLTAFSAAVDKGFAIELDVHLTLEGELVVFHDHTLMRMCQRSETIDRLTRHLRPLMRLSSTEERIPTLEEVLTLVAGKVPVYVEIKARNSYSQLRKGTWLETVEAVGKVLDTYHGPVGVMAWDPRVLRWFKEHHPEVVRVQSGGVVTDIQLLPGLAGIFDNLRLNRFSDPHAISFNALRLPRSSVSNARQSGLPVLAWTIHSPEALKRVSAHADTFIFEGFIPASPKPDEAILPTYRKRHWYNKLGDLAYSRWVWWKEMSHKKRAVIILALLSALVAAFFPAVVIPQVRILSVPLTALAAFMFAMWKPRSWVFFSTLVGVWALVANLYPDDKARVWGIFFVYIGALLGAAIRTIKPPKDPHQ